MRVTRKAVEERIALVKSLAAIEGIDRISYGGYTYDGLNLYGAYGTWWLVSVDPQNGSQTDVGNARGLREVYSYLNGMLGALESIRYTRQFQFS